MIKTVGEKNNGNNSSSWHFSHMPGETAKWKQQVGSWINELRASKRDLGGIVFKFNEMDEVSWEKVWA